MGKIYKRNCNTCGKYYEGYGKLYCSHLCFIHTEKTKRKISKSNKGKKRTKKWKKEKSKTMKGNTNGFKKGNVLWKKVNQKPKGKKVSKALKGKPKSEKHKRKLRETHLGKKHTKETKKKNREWSVNNPNRVFKDTKIELKIETELKRRNSHYEKQIPLCKIAIVDFLLPEHKIVIQCDGCYYHGCPIHYPNYTRSKKRDKNQDIVLKENGYIVYRFWEHEINESAKKCIDKIKILL